MTSEYFIRKVVDWDKLEAKFFETCTMYYNRHGVHFGYKTWKMKPREVFEFFKNELTK